MQTNEEYTESSLSIVNREKLSMTGVIDILSFDESNIYADTAAGKLLIFGSGLKILSMDTKTGDMTVSGHVVSLAYNDKSSGKKTSLLSKLSK